MGVIAVYPGTFDPVTMGHVDLIVRGLRLFDQIIVAVARGSADSARRGAHKAAAGPLFSVEERVQMLEEAVAGLDRVTVRPFDGLLVDFVRSVGARVVLRGVRAFSDYEYEFNMALANRRLDPEIETVFMMPNEALSYISSSLVKEMYALGADVTEFVPPGVVRGLAERLGPPKGVDRGGRGK